MINRLESFSETIRVNDVPSNGRLSYLLANEHTPAGVQSTSNSYYPPSCRSMTTVAEWKEKNTLRLQMDPIKFALDRTLGKYTMDRKSAGGTSGVCYYQCNRNTVVSN